MEPVGLERGRGQQWRDQSVLLVGPRGQDVSVALLLVLHTLPRSGPLRNLLSGNSEFLDLSICYFILDFTRSAARLAI